MTRSVLILIMLGVALGRLSSFKPEGPSSQHRPFTPHPQAKGSKIHQSVQAPHATNAWFQNFLLDNGQLPVNVLPLAFAVKDGSIEISTSDPKRNINQPNFVASVFVADWTFEHHSTINVVDYSELSVTWAGENINIPMVQGMPFFTVELNGIAPNLRTIAAVISVRNPSGKFAPGQAVPPSNWFTIELNSGLFWVLYSSVPVALSTTGSSVSFPQAVTGYVRIGCIGSTDIVEQLLPFLPTYPTSGDVDYTFTDDHYILNFDFETKGQGELLMMALPHHMDLIQNPQKVGFTLPSVKGSMVGLKGSKWTLQDKLVKIEWDAPRDIDPSKRAVILDTLKQDMQLEYPDPDDNDPYWFGLKIAKFARLALIADSLGEDTIAATIRSNIAQRMTPWLTGKNKDTLKYDTTYGGIVSIWGLNDKGADYGQGYYNDHYFHYGYHLYAIAVVARKDLSFYKQFESQILDLVQDVANPDWDDKFFTVARHKDFYAGHSWANGLFAFTDNRNQESTSESYNCYYALYLLGLATSNNDLKNWGNLLLASELQSTKKYWHMPAGNDVYPAAFSANKMVGMVWSFKADHATWFGSQEIFIHGIQMIPFLPITELSMDEEFVREEYPVLMGGVKVEEWRAFEIMDHAIIDPAAAWVEAMTYDRWGFTHAGQTKTNTLWWIATRPAKAVQFLQ